MKSASYIIIYIDYKIILNIVKQITLIKFLIIKLNFRIIRALKYIQRFKNLEFRYKFKK